MQLDREMYRSIMKDSASSGTKPRKRIPSRAGEYNRIAFET
jgi:hypothetical protein